MNNNNIGLTRDNQNNLTFTYMPPQNMMPQVNMRMPMP